MKSRFLFPVLSIIFFFVYGCNRQQTANGNKSATSSELPEHIISDEIILALEPSSDIKEIQKDFIQYDFKILRTIAPNPPMYLVTYDVKKIDPLEMIKQLKAHEMIKEAEFNKKTTSRN